LVRERAALLSAPRRAPRTLDRRRLLAELALAALALPAAVRPAPRRRERARRERVVVVGAGLAGLAAARALDPERFEVVVLEARERLGGRVFTDRSLGFPVDLGAAWLEGGARNPLAPLLRIARLTTVASEFDDVALFAPGGERVGEAEVEDLDEALEELVGEVEALAEELDGDRPLAHGVERVLAGWKLEASERRLLDWALATVVLDAAAELSELSLAWADEGEDVGGVDRLVPDGLDRLVAALAAPLDVRTGEEVRRIERVRGGVLVESSRGVRRAERAVVAVPLALLGAGAIGFEPELPEAMRAAVARLGVGLLDKVALRFARPFWPPEREFLGIVAARPGDFPVFLAGARLGRPDLLIGFVAGERARELEAAGERAAVRAALATLATAFGGRVGEPIAALATRWGADPFARGAYSFLPVGATPDDRRALQAPVGERLFFAGEATAVDFPATMHGAWLSGVEAAERLARAAR
jgi:monoamine oxidase